MAIGGLLAIVVLLEFGKDAETDGFFAAYGVYAVLLALAQSLRATVVAKLVEGGAVFASLDRLLGAAVIVTALAVVLLTGLGRPLAALLTGDLGAQAESTARTALAILGAAAGAQFVAALAAAALGTRGDFALPGLAYVVGGVVSIGLVLALDEPLGIDAVSVGVVAGSLLTAGLMLWRLAAAGWRPRLARLREGWRALGTMGLVLSGSIGSLGLQLTYVISLAFAARLGEGAVTLYSYAFFAAALLMGAVAGPAAIVLAAPLTRTWDRRPDSLRPHLVAVLRAGLALVVPVLAIAALAGDEAIEAVLGGSLSAADADQIVGTFLAMAGMVFATVAMPVPALAAYATSRYVAVGAIAVAGLAAHLAASAVAIQTDELEALGAAASLGSLLSLALMLALVWRGAWAGVMLAVLWQLVRIVAVAALAFGPPALGAVLLGNGAWDVLAALAGAALMVPLVRIALPDYWEVVLRLAPPLARGRGHEAHIVHGP
jgi:peptidoglycan biosynthesis protein MviN/MurJ (putative lipid II flippase)